jgi:predicted nucleotidyltransferase
VIAELTNRKNELDALCRKYHVKRLDVFGSASTEEFNPGSSDLDFLVEFESLPPTEHADAYFGFLSALQKLFSQNIDLVELQAINNPFFLKSVEESRLGLYAA